MKSPKLILIVSNRWASGKMKFICSGIGKKYLMGVTGLIWSLFVMQHMLGNFLIFCGPEAYNAYSHAIVSNPILLYGGEAFLLTTLLVHIITAVLLTLENKAARGSAYLMTTSGEKGVTFASRTMIFTGLLILAFVVYHRTTLLHLNTAPNTP